VAFSETELEQFRADGFVTLRGGVAREVAAECREFVWKEILSWRGDYSPVEESVRQAFNPSPGVISLSHLAGGI
jgi:hypothetical protein